MDADGILHLHRAASLPLCCPKWDCVYQACVCLRMSPDHPSYSETNKWKGGLKFLLPAFKAHKRHSSVIEVRGEGKASRGWARGLTQQTSLKSRSLALQSTHSNLALTLFWFRQIHYDLFSWGFVSTKHVLLINPDFHASVCVVFLSPAQLCWRTVFEL